MSYFAKDVASEVQRRSGENALKLIRYGARRDILPPAPYLPILAEMNRLQHEKSPYLLQHKENPVDWYPWGTEAFSQAEKLDRPIFLSIGYSTCYWCHVMEKDSFEHQSVADVLNEGFICIKVDREERPDIDAIYMEAVQSMTGHGGWPMSVFLTPQKKPFYGGTFFYREHFLEIINALQNAWQRDREKIENSAAHLTSYLSEREIGSSEGLMDADIAKLAYEEYLKTFDEKFGGFGDAPKFPPSAQIAFLLRYYKRTGNQHALKIATTTLSGMACGGIYDHLGGGFSRYSTDAMWTVPHFEKMLYDNALLARVYFEAYQLTETLAYKDVGCQTLDYVLRDMTSPEGSFYSAEDAGEVDKEGEYYVWSYNELKQILSSEELALLENTYEIHAQGNFEGNIVFRLRSLDDWARKNTDIQRKLLHFREKRQRPHRDEKVLTSWNSLMISALVKGFLVTGNERYSQSAQRAANFLIDNLIKEDVLYHRSCEGEVRYAGNLDDYAFSIAAFLDLYQCQFEIQWIEVARNLVQECEQRFSDSESQGYFYSQSDDVLYRKKELLDNALPSSNGVMLQNLYRLYQVTGVLEYRERAERLRQAFQSLSSRYPAAIPTVLQVEEQLRMPPVQLVISECLSPEKDPAILALRKSFFPHVAVSIANSHISDSQFPLLKGKSSGSGRTTYFVCHEGSCQEPTEDFARALELIEKNT